MTKRTFIAINFDTPTKLALAKLLSRLPKSSAISPTKIDNLHLTLKFLGEMEEGLLPDLTIALDQLCIHFASFELNFGKIGAFPNWQNPQIIWLELLSDQLWLLQYEIEHQIKTVVISQGNKPFKPHLTLARVKTALPEPIIRDLYQLNPNWAVPRPYLVKSIELMTSQLTPSGPIYTLISSHRLAFLQ